MDIIGCHRWAQEPVILRRGLPNVHAGDGARNDETLDLRSPFKDRVDPVGATIRTGHGTFLKEVDPQMSRKTRFGPVLDRSQSPIVGLARAPLKVAGSVTSG